MRILAIFVATIFLSSCSGGGDGPTAPVAPGGTGIPVSVQILGPNSILVGDGVNLTGQAMTAGGQSLSYIGVTWASSDTSIAKVGTGGELSGILPGEATITATLAAPYSGIKASFRVIVSADIITAIQFAEVPGLLTQSSAVLVRPIFIGSGGGAMSLGAQEYAMRASPVTYSSQNPMVAPVDANGIVVGARPGVSEITVSVGVFTSKKTLAVSATPVPIEVVITDSSMTVIQRMMLYKAVARWAAVFSSPLPAGGNILVPQGSCDGAPGGVYNTAEKITIVAGRKALPEGVSGRGGMCITRSTSAAGYKTGLAVIGAVNISTSLPISPEPYYSQGLFNVWSHEIGHVFGLMSNAGGDSLISGGSGADPRWVGAEAARQYVLLGGPDIGVPLQIGPSGTGYSGHWRSPALAADLMSSSGGQGSVSILSAVTIGAMKDLGYPVDVSRAESFPTPQILGSIYTGGN